MRIQTPAQRLIREREAAAILGLAVKTLQRWRWEGRGPRFHKIGAAVRYDIAELERFIADAERLSTSEPPSRVSRGGVTSTPSRGELGSR